MNFNRPSRRYHFVTPPPAIIKPIISSRSSQKTGLPGFDFEPLNGAEFFASVL